MFRNYLKTAFRNILKYKGHSLINILGLAIGMTCFILIILYIQYEMSFDKYHANADHIYRLGMDAKIGGKNIVWALSNIPSAPALVEEFPEIVSGVRLIDESKVKVSYNNIQFCEDKVLYADNTIFEIFSFPLIKGNSLDALTAPYSVVLTKSTSKKYFGDDEPVGKTLTFNNEHEFTITGIVEDVPSNSQFTFDILCSFETFLKQNPKAADEWMSFSNIAYILVDPSCDIDKLAEKLPIFVDSHMGEAFNALGGTFKYILQPLTDIHLYSNMEFEFPGSGDIQYIYIFLIIAIGILAIAYINYINLITARSAIRAKEIGVRKTLGASKGKLAKQFITESVLYSLMALGFSLIMVELFLPVFNSISGCNVHTGTSTLSWLIPILIVAMLILGMLTGIYPAYYLASFSPLAILKGTWGKRKAKPKLRNILVIGQFTISIALIAGTIIILNQIKYMKTRALGFNKDHVLVIEKKGNSELPSIDLVKHKLMELDDVIRVTASTEVPGEFLAVSAYLPEGFSENETQLMNTIYVDHDFIPSLEIELVEGRNFLPGSEKDIQESILINETALKKFGWSSGLGKTIKDPEDKFMEWKERKVVGVIKDYHMQSLHRKIEPLFVGYIQDGFDAILVKIKSDNIANSIKLIEKTWEEIAPSIPFDYYFLDKYFNSQYEKEERLKTILLYFTCLAIFIACLGLYGMSSFTIEQRTKEIGVRKVLGASTAGIAGLMTRGFLLPVTISNIIAWPIVYFVVNRWLEGFAYRVELNILMFLTAGIIALIIAVITVSYQAIKAASANPVETLRYE